MAVYPLKMAVARPYSSNDLIHTVDMLTDVTVANHLIYCVRIWLLCDDPSSR
jgi:hypothetical protein